MKFRKYLGKPTCRTIHDDDDVIENMKKEAKSDVVWLNVANGRLVYLEFQIQHVLSVFPLQQDMIQLNLRVFNL